MNNMRLGIDPVAMGVLLVAFVFSRIPGVNARLGYGAVGAACGFVAFRYWQRGLSLQFNLVMMGLSIALALYYLWRAVLSAPKRRAPAEDDD